MKSTTDLSMLRAVRAMQYPKQGLRCAWRDEAAFRQELVLVIALAPLTLWLRLPRIDTVLLLALLALMALMALVLAAEQLNSGLEAVVDMSTAEFDVMAGKAKACCSAAVFLALLTLGGAWRARAGPTLWIRIAR